MRSGIWAAFCGDGGADTTAEAVSKPPSHGLQANHCGAADALYQTARPVADGQGLRQAGRGDPNPHRRPQSLHGAWHTSHKSRGLSPSGDWGSPTLT
jgi:hypothetical protein